MPYKLVLTFFHTFSRFEYALKRGGFLKKTKGNAEPNWVKFAETIDTPIHEIKNQKFQEAVVYFFDNPPKKQIVDAANNLAFKEYSVTPENKNLVELLVLVRRVRNNLFHGGKFTSGPEIGTERNETLLKYSLVILESCLEMRGAEQVKLDFYEDFSQENEFKQICNPEIGE